MMIVKSSDPQVPVLIKVFIAQINENKFIYLNNINTHLVRLALKKV